MIQITIVGNIGQEPELKQLQSGAVLNLSVAVNDRVKKDGQWVDETHWFRVTMFGARAEGLTKILQKGSKVAVAGKLQPRTYKSNKDGQERVILDVIAWDVMPVGNLREKGEQPGAQGAGYSRPQHSPGSRQPRHRESQGAQYGGAAAQTPYRPAPSYSPPPAQFGPPESPFDDDDQLPF